MVLLMLPKGEAVEVVTASLSCLSDTSSRNA
jgi:hypothetical protein